jgi:hypothetical protein
MGLIEYCAGCHRKIEKDTGLGCGGAMYWCEGGGGTGDGNGTGYGFDESPIDGSICRIHVGVTVDDGTC